MKIRKVLSGVLAVALIASETAFCWGGHAHFIIDHTAIDTLPDDGPIFLKKYTEYIASSSGIPDSWRNASEPFSKIEEDPNHGWFREQFAFMKPIPRSRYEFVLALYREYLRIEKSDPENAKRMNVRWTGTLPYAAVEVYGHLVADMRALRKDRAAGKDTAFLEQTCAFYVAWMGHYIGDGSQPMHDSIYSDGWRGPNPKGYTQDGKIHGRFESRYVDLIGLSESDIVGRIGKPAHLKGDVFDLVLDYLNASGNKAEAIYAMDKRNAFVNPNDAEAKELVYSQTAAGAGMLRDLVYRAWLESALPPRKNISNPVDQSNPNYNSETGSAPAALSPSLDH